MKIPALFSCFSQFNIVYLQFQLLDVGRWRILTSDF